MRDMLAVLLGEGLSNTFWIWARTKGYRCPGMAVVCRDDGGTVRTRQHVLELLHDAMAV